MSGHSSRSSLSHVNSRTLVSSATVGDFSLDRRHNQPPPTQLAAMAVFTPHILVPAARSDWDQGSHPPGSCCFSFSSSWTGIKNTTTHRVPIVIPHTPCAPPAPSQHPPPPPRFTYTTPTPAPYPSSASTSTYVYTPITQ